MTSLVEVKNAVISRTTLGYEDHGILSAYVGLDYGGSVQSFGGYALDKYDAGLKRRIGTAYGTEFIIRVLRVLGVDSWEKVKGQHCRARASTEHVYAIGHILEDRWFNAEGLADEMDLP